jgi:putative ABC transport system permease protein
LVGIAFLIAAPIAWYFLHKWLEGYPYRIHIGWWVFALTGAATVLIALFTVSFQAIRAGMVSPVKSLRAE